MNLVKVIFRKYGPLCRSKMYEAVNVGKCLGAPSAVRLEMTQGSIP